ncbi:hypothetical protein Tcan_01858 [Toxocara canis]|uniref:Uncharacterized protein n=1 Tax=Toxocara canis TaxID=6265 RepID=A0A0B2UTD4_TOXCA|nr:hypothetical protein Tcan_01858 [Toxocara canis]
MDEHRQFVTPTKQAMKVRPISEWSLTPGPLDSGSITANGTEGRGMNGFCWPAQPVPVTCISAPLVHHRPSEAVHCASGASSFLALFICSAIQQYSRVHEAIMN